jgi:hypothetical protein
MGIFGINMLLLYGEEELAFVRLQEELMKVSDGNIFALKSNEQNHGGLLATSPDAFEKSDNIVLRQILSLTTDKPRLGPLHLSLAPIQALFSSRLFLLPTKWAVLLCRNFSLLCSYNQLTQVRARSLLN